MKFFLSFVFLVFASFAAFGQNEQAPVVEKDITYKDWSYKNIRSGETTNLRDLVKVKKLVMVVYFAAWCPNWKHDAPMVEKLYEKYKKDGLEIVGVSEYDTVDATRANLDVFKITFPVVTESEARADRLTTTHYQIRTSTGDTRKWGSPWYIFLEPKRLEKKGDVLVNKAQVVNGEIVEMDVDKMIAEKLGVSATKTAALAKKTADVVCEPDTDATKLKKP